MSVPALPQHPYRRFVAVGDSFTEGVGDPDPARPNGLRGWADRVAEQLAATAPDLGYANLAVRGRLLGPILAEQVEPAVALAPDLVTVYAGGNDILRPKVDLDALVASYAGGLARLASTGARLLVFTGFDLGLSPVFGRLRGRVAVYNELVREVADDLGATVVDYWRLREYRDSRLWDVDRLHMSPRGHTRMAVEVLDTLGVAHGLRLDPLGREPLKPKAERREENLDWAKAHALPWVERRLRGTSSGDTVTAKRPTLAPIAPAPPDL